MADLIRIDGIRGFGHHGVLPEETRDGQWFVVDVELRLDLEEAARTDDLTTTVDYGELAQNIHNVITGPPFLLIERLAVAIADVCLNQARVESVQVTVHKPSAPIPVDFGDVSVILERTRS